MFKIRTRKNQRDFVPGEEIDVKVFWDLDAIDDQIPTPERVELRVAWNTQGKGSTDLGIAVSAVIDQPERNGEKTFRLVLPQHPYSYSGPLISIVWALEFVALPLGKPTARKEIVIAPDGKEVRIK